VDSSLRSLALSINSISKFKDTFTFQELLECYSGKKSSLEFALNDLLGCDVISRTENHCGSSFKVDTSRNFVTLLHKKRVNVSVEGNKYVRVIQQIMSLKNGTTELFAGSTYWEDKQCTPKHRVGKNALRLNLIDPPRQGKAQLVLEQKNRNHVAYKLRFDPPLDAGEYIKFSFSVWIRNYYAKSFEEVRELYDEKWIREGLAVAQPTMKISIEVILPEGYGTQEAIVERNPVLSIGGPNIPGELLSCFLPTGGRTLFFRRENPSLGAYFISWVPPMSTIQSPIVA
jgi:hypothetical protein